MINNKSRRRQTTPVRIGVTAVGGNNPVRIQSMTNTATLDTEASVAQCLRIAEAGADIVGDADLVEKIQGGWMDFDVAVASPDMMGFVGRLGKVLGPRGLMPSPKAGTVTMDVAKAVTEAKAGKIEYRLDKTNIIHCPIGKASFGQEKLLENFNALLDAIIKAKPAALKGQYIKSVAVASTMGPGVRINPNKVGTVSAQ